MSTPLENCRYNMQKGLWETHPEHWVYCNEASWIVIAFPLATTLERGVPS